MLYEEELCLVREESSIGSSVVGLSGSSKRPASRWPRWPGTSAFYKHLDRPPAEMQLRRLKTGAEVKKAFDGSSGAYGSPRGRAQLRRDGLWVSKKTVEASMARQGLSPAPSAKARPHRPERGPHRSQRPAGARFQRHGDKPEAVRGLQTGSHRGRPGPSGDGRGPVLPPHDPLSPAAPGRGPSDHARCIKASDRPAKGFDDPLNGEGARRFGGRFNPPLSFPVVYACKTHGCATAELVRQARGQSLALEDLLPREFWRIEGELNSVLDLLDDSTLNMIGIDRDDLIRDHLALTHQIGEAACEHQLQAILTPPATGVGQVLAIFTENLAGAVFDPKLIGEWKEAGQLPI